MASTKRSIKRVCTSCQITKAGVEYLDADATVCNYCVSMGKDQVLEPPPPEPPKLGKPPRITQVAVPGTTAENEEGFTFASVEIDPQNPSIQELAHRIAAQKFMLPFIQRFRPKYKAGWVHKDICRRLERFKRQVEAGESPRLLLMMPYRHGKLLAHDTEVLTTKGWTTHGELRTGDEVFSPSGRPVKVLATSPDGLADVLVTMSDGSKVQCHENHEWKVYDSQYSYKSQVLETKVLQLGMALPSVIPPNVGCTQDTYIYFDAKPRLTIASVQRVQAKPGRCIQVDSPDGLYVVGENFTPTHNSEITSRHFAPFLLQDHPDWEIIAASNAQSLATSFSRYIRDLMRSDSFTSISSTRLDPSSQSVENWNMIGGGGYMAAGVGTAIIGRGAHCFPAGTLIQSDSECVRIEHLTPGQKVLSYDHETNSLCHRPVSAIKISQRGDLYEIVTRQGRRIVATGDHPVFVQGVGYKETCLLGVGDILTVAQMPGVRGVEGCDGQGMSSMLLQAAQDGGHTQMFSVRHLISKTYARVYKIAKTRLHGSLLLAGVQRSAPRCEECEALRSVQKTSGESRSGAECDVLLAGVSAVCAAQKEDASVPPLRSAVSSALRAAHVLFTRLREQGARIANAWVGKFTLQGWAKLQSLVSRSAAAGIDTRQQYVRGLPVGGAAGCASHQSQTYRQPCGESDHLVSELPRQAPQINEDTVSVVRKLRSGNVEVYDLQVEGTRNFFAEEILVHNCLIIDDPVRDAEAADSQVQRDNTWEWYNSTAYSRLAPGGGVLGILTCWNDDDWAGRIAQTMLAGGDQFEIVKYPAINDHGDEYILVDDTIHQFPPGSTIPEGAVMTRPMNSALHEERYSLKALLKIKANYYASGQKRWWAAGYQQNPAPEDGAYFTKKMFSFYTNPPMKHQRHRYQAWDFAITEAQQNDYTVCVTVDQDHADNIYIIDVDRFKSSDGEAIAQKIISNYAEGEDVTQLGVEDSQIWKSIESTFTRLCTEQKVYPSYQILKPFTDKFVRAQPLRGRMQAHKVWFNKEHHYYEELEKELLRFGAGGKHDDQVDALAWVIRLVLMSVAPREPEVKKMKSWRDKLRSMGAGGSHMAA